MVLYLTEINSSLKWLLLYSLSLFYFVISSEGKFRNGEKYQSKTISKIKNYNRDQYSKTYCSYVHLIQILSDLHSLLTDILFYVTTDIPHSSCTISSGNNLIKWCSEIIY